MLEEEDEKPVSITGIFRYADSIDWTYMIIGALMACGHGILQVPNVLLEGDFGWVISAHA